MSWCLLGEENFRLCCGRLLQHSDQLGDGWSWEQVQGSEEGYLRKTVLRSEVSAERAPEGTRHSEARSEPDELEQEADTTEGDGDEDEDECGITVTSAGGCQLLQYEYHILYSCSYRTPVLYFRAFTLEGRSLSSEDVWSRVHPNLRLQRSPLNTISQQEHPLLGQPFFMLHPCRTEEFMKLLLLPAAQEKHRSVNYIVTWLSVVGPLVGLDVPLQYSILQQQTEAPSHEVAAPP